MAGKDRVTLCNGCWSQMHMPIPIRGPLSLPFRLAGIAPSKMNPNVCTICERAFATIKKSKQISSEATILFADLRGYTRLTERIGAADVAPLLRAFYDQCAQAIWRQDGIVNKSMGDGLLAIFNFPIQVDDHPRRALTAARDIQRNCGENLRRLQADLDADEIGVGVGIDSGPVEIGEFSVGHTDYTAIGSVVNLAARLESHAAAGEILVSVAVHDAARDLCADAPRRHLEVKGFDRPVDAWAVVPYVVRSLPST